MKPTDEMARIICREECAFRGEPPCFELPGEWPNPNCAEPGCSAIAAALASQPEAGATPANVLRELIEAVDAGKVKIEGPEIGGGGDPEIAAQSWPGEDEWLHYARQAVAAPAPSGMSKAAGKQSDVFVFEPGSLTVHGRGYAESEGSGYFQFDESDLDFYPHDEKEGSFIRIRLDQSELVELRDFLVRRFPSALRDGEDALRTDKERNDER